MRAPNISLFSRVIGGQTVMEDLMAPNISLFPRVIGPVWTCYEGSKHFIVFKGYRRTLV